MPLANSFIQITSINSAPTLTNIEAQPAVFVENGAPAGLTGNLTVADPDDTLIESASVTITNFVSGEDQLSFVAQPPINGFYTGNTLTLVGSASLAQYEAVLRSVAYTNTSDSPTGVTRTLSVVINDGNVNSNIATRDIEISPLNDAPALSTIEGQPASYTEGGLPVGLTRNISVADIDDTLIESAQVTINGNFASGQDLLLFTDQNGISGDYDSTTGVLDLTGTATKTIYETALRTITYTNNSGNPSDLTRSISITINDGDINSNALSRDIEFTTTNDPPFVSGIEVLPVDYVENASDVGLTNGITLADVDDANFESATIAITSGYATGEDQLNFTDQNGIFGNYNPTDGILSLSGSATVADYQAALRSVTYSCLLYTSPSPRDRTRSRMPSSA